MVQRTKLELEVNKPVEIELLYDEPINGESQYGIYNLYAVKVDDSEFAFFPPKEVHESLRELRAGDKAVVTKLAAQRGNRIISTYDVSINGKATQQKNMSNAEEKTSESNTKIQLEGYYDVMLQSLKDGMKLSEEINGLSLDQIIRISLSLFIQRTKNGHSNNGFNY